MRHVFRKICPNSKVPFLPSQRRHRHHQTLPPPNQMTRVLEYWLYLSHAHAIRQILLIGQQQERYSGQMIVLNHAIKDSLRLIGSLSVVRVNHIDQGMALLVVLKWMGFTYNLLVQSLSGSPFAHLVPQRLQLLLSTQVPEAQPDALHVYLANVQAYSRRDLTRIHAYVVLDQFCFGLLQVGLQRRRVSSPRSSHWFAQLTVFPASSRPRIRTQYSSFCLANL